MPRLPVDGKKVVEHRITFGTKERDMIEGALAAFQFNRVATPVVAGMSDMSFMLVLGGLLAIYFPEIKLPTNPAGMQEIVEAIDSGIKEGVERARIERELTGNSPLDEASGPRDFLGRLYYNLTNPNWSPGLDFSFGGLI
jgi:hypothetical protein